MEESKVRKSTNPDPKKLVEDKAAKSAVQFKTTRVASCSQVLVKNGQAVAVPFAQKLTGYKAKNSYVNTKRSSETASISQQAGIDDSDAFRVRPNLHVGVLGKPLERYDPNANRSRMPEPTIVMPYKNSSQVQIGDRSGSYKRQYVSTYSNSFKPGSDDVVSNQGIISERIKWHRFKENQ